MLSVCVSAGASLHQQAGKQQRPLSEDNTLTSTARSPDYSSPRTPTADLTFHNPSLGRSSAAARAATTSPDPFAPDTPDHGPALPPCKVNPISDNFHSMLASREDARCGDAVLSSFQQLLGSKDVGQQARLSRFQELLASQEVEQEGAKLTGLASRVQGMAAQLDALQKRTQVGEMGFMCS